MPMPMIMLMLEVADDHPGLQQTVPMVAVEALRPKAIVERFDITVVPRGTRRDVAQPDLAVAEPLQRLRNQLRAVVHPQHPWRAARRGEHRFEFGDQVFCSDRTLDQMQQ